MNWFSQSACVMIWQLLIVVPGIWKQHAPFGTQGLTGEQVVLGPCQMPL